MKYINVREYRNGNKKRTIKKNWQHRFTQDEGKQNKNTICVGHYYANKKTNNVNNEPSYKHLEVKTSFLC
jgi:hypothetical protein